MLIAAFAPLAEADGAGIKAGRPEFLTQLVRVAAQKVKGFRTLCRQGNLDLIALCDQFKTQAAKLCRFQYQFRPAVAGVQNRMCKRG